MDLIVKYLERFGASYRLGGGHSPSEILNVLSKLMNMCVVSMMKETSGGKCNEKLLTGYTQFHHLLLALNERFPGVAALAQKRVNKFMKTLFVECCRRRVLWYLKDCGALANIDAPNDAYCQKVFELTEVSRGVVAFQVAFLKTFALPKQGETL